MANIDALLEAADYIAHDEVPLQSKVHNTRARVSVSKDFHPYSKNSKLQKKKATRREQITAEQNDTGRRPGGSGTRASHNKLEKNRRAHMKECFDNLKSVVPGIQHKKLSNLRILKIAQRYIEQLRRSDIELAQQVEQLKNVRENRLSKISALTAEIKKKNPDFHIDRIQDAADVYPSDEETKSDSTETADEDPILSEDESAITEKQQVPVAIQPRIDSGTVREYLEEELRRKAEAKKHKSSTKAAVRQRVPTIKERLQQAEAKRALAQQNAALLVPASPVSASSIAVNQPCRIQTSIPSTTGNVQVALYDQLPEYLKQQIQSQLSQNPVASTVVGEERIATLPAKPMPLSPDRVVINTRKLNGKAAPATPTTPMILVPANSMKPPAPRTRLLAVQVPKQTSPLKTVKQEELVSVTVSGSSTTQITAASLAQVLAGIPTTVNGNLVLSTAKPSTSMTLSTPVMTPTVHMPTPTVRSNLVPTKPPTPSSVGDNGGGQLVTAEQLAKLLPGGLAQLQALLQNGSTLIPVAPQLHPPTQPTPGVIQLPATGGGGNKIMLIEQSIPASSAATKETPIGKQQLAQLLQQTIAQRAFQQKIQQSSVQKVAISKQSVSPVGDQGKHGSTTRLGRPPTTKSLMRNISLTQQTKVPAVVINGKHNVSDSTVVGTVTVAASTVTPAIASSKDQSVTEISSGERLILSTKKSNATVVTKTPQALSVERASATSNASKIAKPQPGSSLNVAAASPTKAHTILIQTPKTSNFTVVTTLSQPSNVICSTSTVPGTPTLVPNTPTQILVPAKPTHGTPSAVLATAPATNSSSYFAIEVNGTKRLVPLQDVLNQMSNVNSSTASIAAVPVSGGATLGPRVMSHTTPPHTPSVGGSVVGGGSATIVGGNVGGAVKLLATQLSALASEQPATKPVLVMSSNGTILHSYLS